jgi:dynein assembly factor 2
MKIFINFCSCADLDKPSFTASESGQSWSLPHSINKIRYDQDSQSHVCNTADVAFHPEALQLCTLPAFQKMVIHAGLEGVGKQLGERKEAVSFDYVVMRNLRCKGGEPALMPIRFDEAGGVVSGQGERGREGRETKLQREIGRQKEEAKKKEQPEETPVFDEI